MQELFNFDPPEWIFSGTSHVLEKMRDLLQEGKTTMKKSPEEEINYIRKAIESLQEPHKSILMAILSYIEVKQPWRRNETAG